MDAASATPCRLFAIMARHSPWAVIFRRGPTRQVELLSWNTVTDQIVHGQWFRGRIYERRCDLTPDGSLLVYFAMNGHWRSEARGSWTAISRPPFLTAVTLWPWGDCWNGGGLFIDGSTLFLNGTPRANPLGPVPRGLRLVFEHPYARLGNNECLGVYYPRLVRDGWQVDKATCRGTALTTVDLFTRANRSGYVLRKRCIATLEHRQGRGVYYDEHELVTPGGEVIDLTEAEWADWDSKGRLLYARHGVLCRASFHRGKMSVAPIADLNADVFTRVPPPPWAKAWP